MPTPECVLFKPQDSYPLDAKSRQLLPVNMERKFLSFQNLGTVNVWVQFSREAAFEECLRVPPGQFIAYDRKIPGNEIYARAETGTSKLVVTEA